MLTYVPNLPASTKNYFQLLFSTIKGPEAIDKIIKNTDSYGYGTSCSYRLPGYQITIFLIFRKHIRKMSSKGTDDFTRKYSQYYR